MTTALVLPVLLVHQRCAPLMIRGESSSPCLRSLHTLPLVSRTYVFFSEGASVCYGVAIPRDIHREAITA